MPQLFDLLSKHVVSSWRRASNRVGQSGAARSATSAHRGALVAVACVMMASGSQTFAASLENSAREAHTMLTELCDDHGGRLTGTVANNEALKQLASRLRDLGLKPEMKPFKMPGWARGEDEVELLAPFARKLRVSALGYTQPHARFEADVIAAGMGTAAEYPADVRGKIVLLGYSSALASREMARTAIERGAKGILLTNREGGGQLLARTGSMIGEDLSLPIYSLAQEEGQWLQRLLARGQTVRVSMETRSHTREIDTANLSLTFPGKSPERIIVGAHFDSWDLGQGAMDNGLGVAQLFALAHALRGRDLPRTIQLMWFNGEEQGLWGSRHAAAELGDAPVVAMINLDMVGVPVAVNSLGDESLVPALERWNASRGERKLPLGVQAINWFGSDHTPYQVAGVRAITFNAPIPRDSVRYYHDFADTIDKLPVQIVIDSTATIADLIDALLEDTTLQVERRNRADTKKLFTTFALEKRMQAIGYWPFDDQ